MTRTPTLVAALLLAATLGACASSEGPPATTAAEATDPGDPYEGFNRQVLDVNLRVDRNVLRPVAVAYRENIGSWTRTRIRNFLLNIDEPAVTANNILQGRIEDAGDSLVRFGVNTTLGGLGLFDVATDLTGTPRQQRDLGQTFYSWGIPDGPYLVVPILGPSNPRDFVGTVGNGFLNPISWFLPFYANLARGAVGGVDEREQNIETLDELQRGSLDFYARLRSVWRQHRDGQLGRTAAETGPAETLDDPEAN